MENPRGISAPRHFLQFAALRLVARITTPQTNLWRGTNPIGVLAAVVGVGAQIALLGGELEVK